MEVAGVGPKTPAAEGRDNAEFRKAALEFEGMLLAAFLQSLQHAGPFSEEEQSAGSDTLQSIAVQATGNALAKRGLLGIADMVEKYMAAHKLIAETGTPAPRQVQPEPPRIHSSSSD